MEPGKHRDLNVQGQEDLEEILKGLRKATSMDQAEEFFKRKDIKLNVYNCDREFTGYTPIKVFLGGLVLSRAYMSERDNGKLRKEFVTYLLVKDNRRAVIETEEIGTGYSKEVKVKTR